MTEADRLVQNVRTHQVERDASPERYEIATLAGQSVAEWTEVRSLEAGASPDVEMDTRRAVDTIPPQKRAAEDDAAATPPKSPKPA